MLVTGGSRGIGRACAVAFAKRGATVVISYAGNEAAAQETLGLIQAAGAKGEAVRFDVADTAACAERRGQRRQGRTAGWTCSSTTRAWPWTAWSCA